ncbi:outer membrane beta-barrel protein [Niabella beijingensis]|uniref:outer membrane beta-barrel protein n=1 Tax=Niabella beijingensis TaxID=2872700 RepID=UPI001CBEF2D5|nr:outer membrane beta-barrel protein [Niabella beijingensis]MBZ4192476.1 outer membrane beta-barrel protein [Niabella beijingensis]
MKKLLLFILLQWLVHASGSAQTAGIDGTVQNSHRKALPGATVSLQQPGNSAPAISKSCDSSGHYRFDKLSPGKYIITASHTGYLKSSCDTIFVATVPSRHTHHFILPEDSTTLTGVVVQNSRHLIRMEKGKMIINVQQMAVTTGLTGFDLLKKMPGITVDQNETIQMRGSSGINVQIDGKTTYLSGKQLTTYLKGISAEDLNKLELDMAPSAESDAAGNAGIINIIPKKNRQKGYAMDLRTGITRGYFWMPAANISFSRNSKKINLFGSFDYKTPDSHWESSSGNTIYQDGAALQLRRINRSDYKINYYTWHGGTEWQFLPKHLLGIDYMGYLDDYKSSNRPTVATYNEAGLLRSSIHSVNDIKEPYHYDAVNLNYRFDIDSTGKNITADAHYTSYRNYSDGRMTTQSANADGNITGTYSLLSHQPGFIRIRSVQSDATLPFPKFSLRTGVKYAVITNDNAYQFDSLTDGRIIPAEAMSNHFVYRERIAAAYLSAAGKIKNISIDAGLRAEYTNADGYTVKQDINNRRSYLQLFPTLSLGEDLKNGDRVNIAASRRINRPSYSDLNPVRWYTDPYYYYAGNPDLLPEMAWVFSAAYTLKHRYIFTFSYNRSSNYINRKLFRDDNSAAVSSRSANLGSMQQAGLIIAAPLQLFSFWELQLTADLNYMTYPVSQLEGEYRLAKWYGTLTAQQQIRLPAGIKMDLFTQYVSAALRGIYTTKQYFYTDIGFKRSFFAGKLDLQFTLNDAFNTIRYQGVSQSNIVNYWYNDKPDTRKAGISVHYHFGSGPVKGNKKKTEEQERL